MTQPRPEGAAPWWRPIPKGLPPNASRFLMEASRLAYLRDTMQAVGIDDPDGRILQAISLRETLQALDFGSDTSELEYIHAALKEGLTEVCNRLHNLDCMLDQCAGDIRQVGSEIMQKHIADPVRAIELLTEAVENAAGMG